MLAFLYADLIVLPLLDVYRKYYGWKMAAYIGVVFYVTMAVAAIVMDLAFSRAAPRARATRTSSPVLEPTFCFNYTFWLNLIFGALALWLWSVNRRNPMEHGCHHHEAA